jgi:RNA polymerase sigma factor (sigma-70 family)
MADRPDSLLSGFVRRLAGPEGVGVGETLRRFAARGDEAAFETLLRRHGPMVLGVCRRLLADAHDAEDAFQATFVVLVRKARSLRRAESVAGWLYGVAYRTALKARSRAARRRTTERPLDGVPEPATEPVPPTADLRAVLDDELDRLPEKYRAPVVLCYLEGKTFQEAAGLLGWPAGTVSGRLARAKDILARRLTRRGVGLSAGGLSAVWSASASAVVPAAVREATLRAALLCHAGRLASGGVALSVIQLVGEVQRTMLLAKVKTAALAVLTVGVLTGLAATTLLSQGVAQQQQKAPEFLPPADAPDRLTGLLQARVQAAQTEVEARYKEFLAGQGTLATVLEASTRYLEARRELVDKKDVTDLLKDHLRRAKEVERICKARYEAGRITVAEFAHASYYRLEAEIWLERAKTR